MAHFWITRFTKTTHKMTFSLRHRMKQSNLKLTKHEGTDLSWRNIAIWEVIKHEIMEISIWIGSFPKPFPLSGATRQAVSMVTHKCSECKKKLHRLFVFLLHQLSSHRGMSNTKSTEEDYHHCFVSFPKTHLHAIALNLHHGWWASSTWWSCIS